MVLFDPEMWFQQVLPLQVRVNLGVIDQIQLYGFFFFWEGVLPPLQGIQSVYSKPHQQGVIVCSVDLRSSQSISPREKA